MRLDIVDMFYVVKYHPDESYAILEGEKVPLIVEEINDLYDLPNDPNVYPGQRINADPREGDAKNIIKLIAWPGVDWIRMPTRRLQLFLH